MYRSDLQPQLAAVALYLKLQWNFPYWPEQREEIWNLTFNWIFHSPPLTCFLFRLINLSWDMWGRKQWGLLLLPVKRRENPSGDKGRAGDRWRRSEHVSLHKYVQGYRRFMLFSYLHLKTKVEKEEVKRNPATLLTSH